MRGGVNHRTEDTDREIELLKSSCAKYGVDVILAKHWAEGGAGATQLAQAVIQMCEKPSTFKFAYQDTDSLWRKSMPSPQQFMVLHPSPPTRK
jgi:formate--tetrahydrofolate ligase